MASSGLQVAVLCGLSVATATALAGQSIGSMPYVNHRDPPAYLPLSGALADQYTLGHAVFNTDFLAAGTAGAGRRAGLGPIFNAASCDECHNEGAHGRGPDFEGPAPNALVVQLEVLPQAAPKASAAADPQGDPVYGRIFSPAAVAGFMPEGQVSIHYHVIQRTYPDGTAWTLRRPTYELTHLNYGPLAANILIKPRLAPALFGVGLLEAVPGRPPRLGVGRFGWQAAALSIRDQTTRALAHEMGVTSTDRPTDDCTDAQTQCLTQRHPEAPEMSSELLTALLTFEKWLAVPTNPTPMTAVQQAAGLQLFKWTGCSACHQPEYKVALLKPDGEPLRAVIAPFSDLSVHDLGVGLDDHDATGATHTTHWRTAPLWGTGYRFSRESKPTFLHDGRARSIEEAILWHDGEAAGVRDRFEQLPRARRAQLLKFVGAL